MKSKIHPKFFENATITCACGKLVWNVGSTRQKQSVEICGMCHPHWTGEHRIVDTEGRVERFRQRYKMRKS